MHTLELDDYTYQRLLEYATQEGKTPSQWLQEQITRFVTTQNKSRPVGLAEDKGLLLPDSFFEPLPDDFLTAFSEIEGKLLRIICVGGAAGLLRWKLH